MAVFTILFNADKDYLRLHWTTLPL